jgi:hypothetical protein
MVRVTDRDHTAPAIAVGDTQRQPQPNDDGGVLVDDGLADPRQPQVEQQWS